MQKAKNWARTAKEVIGIKEILEIDFNSKSYIFIKKELLVSNSKKIKYKGQNTVYFIILDSLL